VFQIVTGILIFIRDVASIRTGQVLESLQCEQFARHHKIGYEQPLRSVLPIKANCLNIPRALNFGFKCFSDECSWIFAHMAKNGLFYHIELVRFVW
jgi:hypothetical protein